MRRIISSDPTSNNGSVGELLIVTKILIMRWYYHLLVGYRDANVMLLNVLCWQ